jgi:hypothetical protein
MIKPRNVVLVEGTTDVHFLMELLHKHDFKKQDQDDLVRFSMSIGSEVAVKLELKGVGGFDTLRARLPEAIKESGIERVAVMADADDRTQKNRWQSLRDKLVEIGYTDLPEEPRRGGFARAYPSLPTIGQWLAPNNERSGYLEDLAAAMIRKDDTLWPRAIKAVESIPDEERRFGKAEPSQHAYVAGLAEKARLAPLRSRAQQLPRPHAPRRRRHRGLDPTLAHTIMEGPCLSGPPYP